MFLRNGFLILALGFALPAFAADTAAPAPAPAAAAPVSVDYSAPAWADLLRTAVRFNAIDLGDDKLIDEYAAVTDCDIYKFYFKDDFKWQEVRKKIRESAALNSTDYPTHYYMKTVLQLNRYDFDKKIYSFTDNTAIRAVNLFTIYRYKSTNVCTDKTQVHYIPSEFQAVASKPFTLLGIPLAPADAQSLLRLMNADKNTDRQVIVKFNLTITYVARLRKETLSPGTVEKESLYKQQGMNDVGIMRMDAHIDSIEFYEDPEMTKLIYSTKPST